MSRTRFRSGNNTRKERNLSLVGRRKINAYKPLLVSAGVEVITERGLQGLCIETIHQDTAAQQTGVKNMTAVNSHIKQRSSTHNVVVLQRYFRNELIKLNSPDVRTVCTKHSGQYRSRTPCIPQRDVSAVNAA